MVVVLLVSVCLHRKAPAGPPFCPNLLRCGIRLREPAREPDRETLLNEVDPLVHFVPGASVAQHKVRECKVVRYGEQSCAIRGGEALNGNVCVWDT